MLFCFSKTTRTCYSGSFNLLVSCSTPSLKKYLLYVPSVPVVGIFKSYGKFKKPNFVLSGKTCYCMYCKGCKDLRGWWVLIYLSLTTFVEHVSHTPSSFRCSLIYGTIFKGLLMYCILWSETIYYCSRRYNGYRDLKAQAVLIRSRPARFMI